ncbi:hypothetical protein BJV82DRAFT_636247, partial [Fennellomyces sp. T-0311]
MVQKKKSAIWVIFGLGACNLFICQTALQSTSANDILGQQLSNKHWCKMAQMVRMSTSAASIRVKYLWRYRLHRLCVQIQGYCC